MSALESHNQSFADDVQRRLSLLGLQLEALHEALSAGAVAFRACTTNHPLTARGYYFYAETVRGLRDVLDGWEPESDSNIEYVVHPDGLVRLFVLAGDSGTGFAKAELRSRRKRGTRGRLAVNANQLVMDLGTHENDSVLSAGQTWALVHYLDLEVGEVRAEVALPTAIADDGRVNGWERRIVLPSLPLFAPAIPERVTADDVEIEVRRKTTSN